MKHLHLQNQFHKLPTFHRHQLWFERKRVEKNRLFNGLGLVCDHFVLENSAWGYHNFFLLSQHIQHISLSNDFLDLTICNRTNLRYWYWNIIHAWQNFKLWQCSLVIWYPADDSNSFLFSNINLGRKLFPLNGMGQFHFTDVTFFGNEFPKTYRAQFWIYNLFKHSSQGNWLLAEKALSFL